MLPPRHQNHAQRALWIYWPRRILSERGMVVLLLFLAVITMTISLVVPTVPAHVRMVVFDQTKGVLAVLATPAQHMSQLAQHVTGLSDMSSDLTNLRSENARLKQWYNRARQLEAENRSLRGLVNLADLPRARYVTARVIAEGGSAFAQNVVIDAGSDRHVTPNMVAMTGAGVIGRVINVQDHTAQIILLNDVNARIPVVIENSRHRGVLVGDNSPQPRILYLPEDVSVTMGERVLTSGHGGVYAPGLPIGTVISNTAGQIRVQPQADLRRLEVIQLIDFGQLNPFDEPAQLPIPSPSALPRATR